MKPLARYKSLGNSNSPCSDLVPIAERELSAFFHAVKDLFGSEQAARSAEDWLQELIEIDNPPKSAREWRLITAKASARIANRVSASSFSAELTNA